MENKTQPSTPIQVAAQFQPEHPIKPKKAFKKWLLITLVIILVLSLPLGGYLLLEKLKISPKPSKITITIPTITPVSASNLKNSLKISEYGVQIVLSDEIKDAYYINTTASKGYVYLKVRSLDSEAPCKKDDSSTAALSRVGKDEINQMTSTKYSDSFKGKVIENYFYYIDLAQYSCAESSEGKIILEKVREAFTNAEIIQ